MAIKISQLSASAQITSDDFLPIVDSGSLTTKRASASQILDYVTGSTFDSLTVTSLTSSHVSGTTAQFTTISGSTITGSTGLFTELTASNITGTTAQFTITTASYSLIQGDLRVLGTASIAQLTTISQSSLLVGDKYITILSGGVDHIGVDGAGFLWGTSSGPGETTGALGEHAHILYDASRDALEIFPGLYVTGSTTLFDISGTTAQFTIITASYTGSGIGLYDLTASGISNFTNDVRAQFSEGSNITIAGGVISSTGGSGSPGGTNTTIQFNSGSTFSGSNNLIYEYTTNTLSGTTAQFTIVTGSTITGSLAKFTTLSASTAEFSGSVLIYGTASLSSNPSAAYIIYSSSIDKLVAFPGLFVSGNLTGSGLGSFQTVSASTYLGLPTSSGGTPGGTNTTVQFNSGSTFSGSTNLVYNYTTDILSGTTAQFTTITASYSLIQGDLRVLGTASISQLTTISQSSLLVGDKYITILSGGVDHTGIDGAGFLWGTSSGPGETTGALGEHAHVLYDASRDSLQIFPGLYVLGNASVSGNLTVTGSITELSTRKIKTNIQTVYNQLSTISKLNPVSYVRLDDGRKEYGFISEEVKEVYPEFVVGEGISYPKMVSILVSAVKELTDKVEKQQSEIEILKNTRGNL